MYRENDHHCCFVRALAASVVAATAILARIPVAAQDTGPIIIGEKKQLETFGLEEFDASLEFLGQWQSDETKPSGGKKVRDTELLLRETLELAMQGYLGHPNLVHLDLSGRFGFEEEDISSDSQGLGESTFDTIIEYSLLAEVFRNATTPFTLYARQNRLLVNRQFGATLDNDLLEIGGIVSYRSEVTPIRLQMFHREQKQTSPFDDDDFKLTQDTLDGQGQINFSPSHNLIWNYTFDSVTESGFARRSNRFERHDAFMTDTIRFGENNESDVQSALHFRKETGQFATELLRINETLRLRHSRSFETRYDYAFDRQQQPDDTQTLHRGTARLRHQLFESLVTTAEIGGSILETETQSFTSTQLFGDIGVEYTKAIPYGTLVATSNLTYNLQNDGERGSDLQVLDERHVFGPSGLVIIERRSILPSSIVVTSVTRIFTFTEGMDYTVRATSERVEIRRILGGDISEGEDVLIDYRVGPEPSSETQTIGYGGTIRYTINEGFLSGVSVFSRYFEQMQSRSGRGVLLPDNDIRDIVFGVDYDIRNLSLTAQYEMRTGSFSPFDSLRLEGIYTFDLGVGRSVVLSAIYDDIMRTDEDIHTTITRINGRWNQQWGSHLGTALTLTWRDEQDSASFNSQAFEQQLEVSWRYRQTSAFASVRNALINSDVRDSNFQTLVIGIRRDF